MSGPIGPRPGLAGSPPATTESPAGKQEPGAVLKKPLVLLREASETMPVPVVIGSPVEVVLHDNRPIVEPGLAGLRRGLDLLESLLAEIPAEFLADPRGRGHGK